MSIFCRESWRNEKKLSNVIIALPTNSKIVQLFEKNLTGGFNSASTRLGLDSEIILPNTSRRDFDKMDIDESFQA